MEQVREYLLSVTAAAILCGIAMTLVGKQGSISALVKLICGLVLAVTAISPWTKLELLDLSEYTKGLGLEAAAASDDGIAMANAAQEAIITERTEAYILDKATAMGLALSVEVTLTDGVPTQAVLSGAVSPYERKQLTQYIADELGIPEENQQWK